MNKGKRHNFMQLIESKSILIPQIQRDYVQYRSSGKVEKSRENFTKELSSVLTGETQFINLNFIYGYSDIVFKDATSNTPLQRYDAFVPIDGQQRLTTLFLLHLYVYSKASTPQNIIKEKFEGKLFYQTRVTTQSFIDSIVEEIQNHVNSDDIVTSIKNSGWYSGSWENDISVKSCLTMLREFQKHLCKVSDWEKAKTNLNNINFMLLNISDIGKPNELYIKMNSRGRQLTPFENFKSDFYGYLDSKNFNYHNLSENFMIGLDNDWQDMIWKMLKTENSCYLCEKYTDALTKEFIHWIIVNRFVLDEACKNNKLDNIKLPKYDSIYCNMVYPKEATPNSYWFQDYLTDDNAIPLLNEAIKDIYNTFSLLEHLDDDYRTQVLENIFGKVSSDGTFSKTINQYPNRILLFATTKFANCSESNQAGFKDWWRIATNLVNHSEIDKVENFIRACHAINNIDNDDLLNIAKNLSDLYTDTFLSEFSNKIKSISILNAFNRMPSIKAPHIFEEVYKQYLLNKDPINWEEPILKAEKHNYFKGEIGFALLISNNSDDFKEKWDLIENIFNISNDILLRKYFIVHKIKDYYPNMQNGKYRLYKWDDKHHEEDWRGFLRNESGYKAFNNLLEKYKDFGEKDFKKFVETENKKDIDKIGNFEKALINYDDLLKYMSYGRYIQDENGDFYLLKNDDRGKGINYKLYVLYLELKNVENLNPSFPEFTSKSDIKNCTVSVSGKQIKYQNQKFYIETQEFDDEKAVIQSLKK